MTIIQRVGVVVLLALAPSGAAAEVIRVAVTSREPFAADVAGKIGPYERLRGRVVYALDPALETNRGIVDLAAAAPNEEGRVEFYADLEILAPVDRGLAQSTVLYVVNNRGRRTWGADPFLLARGYVTVSSGWIRGDAGRARPAAPGGAGRQRRRRGERRRHGPRRLRHRCARRPPAGFQRAQLRACRRQSGAGDVDPPAARAGPAGTDSARPLAPADRRAAARGGQRAGAAAGGPRRRVRAGRHLRADLRSARLGGAGRRFRGHPRPRVVAQARRVGGESAPARGRAPARRAGHRPGAVAERTGHPHVPA